MGLPSNCNRKFTPLEKEMIKTLYLEGKTIQHIHQTYFKEKCSEGGINSVLRQMNVTRPNGVPAKIKHDYFSIINTEEKAYFIGLLLADGSVRHNQEKGNSYSLRLELKYEDKYIIERLTELLESDNPVKEYISSINRNGWKQKHNAYNTFNSTQIFNDLNKYGIVPNKTLTLNKLPQIDEYLMPHLIRGFFDGDGTVYLTKKDEKLHFGFYGTYDFVTEIKEYLIKKININNNIITKQRTANVSFVTFAKLKDIKAFYNYIYKDANIYLIRKRNIFDSYLNNK
jgi:DNA-binding transcriptional regulator WhiA